MARNTRYGPWHDESEDWIDLWDEGDSGHGGVVPDDWVEDALIEVLPRRGAVKWHDEPIILRNVPFRVASRDRRGRTRQSRDGWGEYPERGR